MLRNGAKKPSFEEKTRFHFAFCTFADTITHLEVAAVLDETDVDGVDIVIKTDVTPYGCGLGTSAALIVALLKALQPRQTRIQVARRASKIGLQLGNQGVQDFWLTALGAAYSESGRVWLYNLGHVLTGMGLTAVPFTIDREGVRAIREL